MKKKIFKKLAAAITAVCMCACVMAPMTASAEKITINESTVSVVGKTFKAYKLFSVTKAEIAGSSPLAYTYNYTIVDAWKADIIDALGLTGTPTEEDIITKIEGLTDSAAYTFASALKDRIGSKSHDATATGTTDPSVTLDLGTNPGYYLVVDTSASEPSAPILITSTDDTAEVTLKSDSLGVEKKIYIDKNDNSYVDNDELFDANTANIGDTVNYYVTADVPDTSAYTSYTYTMTDTFSDGLTYNSDLKITIDNGQGDVNPVPAANYSATVTGQTLKIEFTNFKDYLESLASTYIGGKIIATYSAKVNESALVGTTGNENGIELKYSNDPSDTSSTETSTDTVVTYLGEFNISKVDNSATPIALAGAGFTLYSDPACQNVIYLLETATAGVYNVCESTTPGAETEIITDSTGKLTISGLAAGIYYIKETTAPDGYNGIDDVITMTLTATEDTKTIPDTSIEHTDNEECVWTYSAKIGSNEATTGDTITVVNKTGDLLPETGGMGTRVYTFCGLAIVAGAAGLWIVKRKVASK